MTAQTVKKAVPRKKAAPQEKTTPERKRGRPTKLTPELRTTLITAVRVGTPLKTALGYVGLSDETIYSWRNKAEAGKKVLHPSKDLQAFIDFFGELDKALHEATFRAQRTVFEVMTDPLERVILDDKGNVIRREKAPVEDRRLSLQAAQFHLTHRASADYNTKSMTEVTGADGGPLNIDGKMALSLLRELSEDEDE